VYIIIVGGGEVGFTLAKMLSYEKHDIVIVEQNIDRVKRSQDNLDVKVIHGNGSNYKVLEKAGIKNAEFLVAVTDKDEVNLITCLTAAQYQVPHKAARVKNIEYCQDDAPLNAKSLGIDLIIHPESEVIDAVVRLLKQTAATDIIEFAGGKIILLGVHLDTKCNLLGMNLMQITETYPDLRFRTVAIQRRDRTIIPQGSDIIMKGDRILITTKRESLADFLKIAGKENIRMENIMILGGGQTGSGIARILESSINVKIIESNVDKSEFLADQLQKSLVIRGDGRDLNLLALEGIIDMDGFISVTGDDETNILSCLMAKHLGVPRIISLINKNDYTPIIPTIGIDAYVSKHAVIVDNILKFIRRGNIENIVSIPGISAEALEFVAKKGAKITKKKLSEIGLPKGVILGAVVRGDDFFIPLGDSLIHEEDKVVVFALPPVIRDVEKLFN
jgi:trk system potassium uptake protein TrkA